MAGELTPDQVEMIKVLSSRSDLTPEQQQMVSVLMSRVKPAAPAMEETPTPEAAPEPQGMTRAKWEQLKGKAEPAKLEELRNQIPWDERPAAYEVEGRQAPGLGKFMLGAAENIYSGALTGVGTPISGLAGIAYGGATLDPEKAAKAVEATQNLFSYTPRTESGKQTAEDWARVTGEPMAPVAKGLEAVASKGAEIAGEAAGPTAAGITGALLSAAPAALAEYMGAKGLFRSGLTGKAAARSTLKDALENVDRTVLYDEFGDIKPNVRTQIKDAGLKMQDIEDILPESIATQEAAMPLGQQIAATKTTRAGKMASLAEQFKPSAEKIKAFEDLDMDFLPQYVSENPTAAAIAENLKDVPGSLMAPREKKIVQQLGQRADDIIREGGGTIEKGELATRYVSKANEIIDELAASADDLYNKVSGKVPLETGIETTKVINILNKRAKALGGEEYLEPIERKLLKTLSADKNPTYGRLDKYRRQVGEQLGKKADTPFRNVDRKDLGELYSAMTDDQENALYNIGRDDLLQTYLTGKQYVAQRKGIEKQLENQLGKKLTGSITKNMGTAVKNLADGDTRAFDAILKDIPEDLGDMRKELVVSALNDAFLTGARGKESISIGGFGNWWKKLNRNPKAKAKLAKEIGPDTWKRVETLATVNDALKQTMELSVRTGRQISTPGLFDEVNGIAQRVYGKAKKTAAKIPAIGGMFADVVNAPKNARSIAADELLSDRRFQNFLKQQATGKVDSAKKTAYVNRQLEGMKSFQNWKKTLPEKDLQDLATAGAIGYFFETMEEEK